MLLLVSCVKYLKDFSSRLRDALEFADRFKKGNLSKSSLPSTSNAVFKVSPNIPESNSEMPIQRSVVSTRSKAIKNK